MGNHYRLVRVGEQWPPASIPVEGCLDLYFMRFDGYVEDVDGNICGARFWADLGHGYGFNHGEQEVILHPGETFRFSHDYTDTSDGTWERGFTVIDVMLVEDEL